MSITIPWTETSHVSEIEEEEEEEKGNFSSYLFEINHGVGMASIKEEDAGSLFSVDINKAEDVVYVAVGKSESSLDALSWTLTHFVNTSTVVYLIHVFPEIHHIPSPLGMLPKSKVSPSQVENYMAQERGKRRQLLQKFLNMCSASKVKVDTMLIESDTVAKAILDLIPILNIRKLVVGTRNCSPRKLKSSRRIGIADQIFQNAPETCQVKVVCKGKEVISHMIGSPAPPAGSGDNDMALQEDDHRNDSFSCICFIPKF